jgi:hypothetical protein
LQVAAGFSAGSAVAVLGGGFLFCRVQAAGRRNLTFLLCACTAGALADPALLHSSAALCCMPLLCMLAPAALGASSLAVPCTSCAEAGRTAELPCMLQGIAARQRFRHVVEEATLPTDTALESKQYKVLITAAVQPRSWGC